MGSANEPKFLPHPPTRRFGDATSFDLTLVSVNNLSQRWFSPNIRVYAKVRLDGDIRETGRYLAEGLNSTLNVPVHYPITNNTRGNLVVSLYYERSFLPDSFIGQATLDLRSLFADCHDPSQNTWISFDLPKGKLNVTYRFDVAQAGN